MRHKTYTLYFLSIVIFFKNTVDAQTPTWSENIADIIYTNCSSCHHEGAIAPFSLMDYDDAYEWGDFIANEVESKHMPPWPADPSYRHFKDEAVLTDLEIDQILDWVDAGMPTGDLATAPDAPIFPENGSMLEFIDLTIAIEPYTLQFDTDEYRWFTVTNPFAETIYINAIEVEAGLPDLVHHCDISWDESGISLNYDLEDPLPGFNSSTGYPNYDYYMNAWMAGGNLIKYPSDWGIEVPPGAIFVFEIHYGPGGQGLIDSTKINFQFVQDPTDVRPVYASWLLNNPIAAEGPLIIPADEVVTFHQDYTTPQKRSYLTICPHMHLLGRSYKVWFEDDGDSIPLINIPDWQFHWQKYYTFQKVQVIPYNAHIKSEAVYDNTVFNLDNPNDPPETVYYGSTTEDEMFMTYFLWTNYQNGDEDIILDSTILYSPINNLTTSDLFKLYPNPVRDFLYLQGDINNTNINQINIFNTYGQLIQLPNLNNISILPHRINTTSLPKGIYFIEVITNNGKWNTTFVKIDN